MFQNINIEPEEFEEKVKTQKVDKKALLRENFKIENIILYLLAFGVARRRFWRAELHHLLLHFWQQHVVTR